MEPRRDGVHIQEPRMSASFNGAAASQPRRERNGKTNDLVAYWLQWGRGFSAAESSLLALEIVRIAVLQWGRGFSAAERAGTVAVPSVTLPRFNGAAASQPRRGYGPTPDADLFQGASMGPRLLSRGETIYECRGILRLIASMGPRLLSRGEGGD